MMSVKQTQSTSNPNAAGSLRRSKRFRPQPSTLRRRWVARTWASPKLGVMPTSLQCPAMSCNRSNLLEQIPVVIKGGVVEKDTRATR